MRKSDWTLTPDAERISAPHETGDTPMNDDPQTKPTHPDNRLHPDAAEVAALADADRDALADRLYNLTVGQTRGLIVATQDVANALREESDRLLAAANMADSVQSRVRELTHEAADVPPGPSYTPVRERPTEAGPVLQRDATTKGYGA